MPRIARIVIPNVPHHITQRGNQRQDVFFRPDDRKRYLIWLMKYSEKYRLNILGYCLMTNHVHFIATPKNTESMARTMNITHMRYAQAVFKEQGSCGHLWQGRFFSTALDEKHLWYCMRYIEQNPVKAGLVLNAEDYPWSSAACHSGLRDDPVLTPGTKFSGELDDWSEILKENLQTEVVELIKRRTHSGIPCGDRRFLNRISKKVGFKLVERKRGRPRKSADKTP